MELGLQGKVAIVSAASQGLGLATARRLAKEGTRVVMCARNKEILDKAAQEITTDTNGEVLAVGADISRSDDINRVVDTAVAKFGTVHILVNNTGGPPVADIENLTDAAWSDGFELVLMSMIRFTRRVLPYMRKQKWGRVVTITSIAAKQPIDDLVISSTLRPGIHALSKMLTNKYAHENILCNTIAPGFILTKRQEEIFSARAQHSGTTIDQEMKQIIDNIPVKRMGSPEDVADAIAFLISEKAGYIAGTTLSVDGGQTKGLL